jgi:ribosomal protein S18 acetylase RimI-like enzyme
MTAEPTVQDLEFRDARSDDAVEVVALVESAYRGDASRAGWTTEADLLAGQRTDVEEVASILMDSESRLLLAVRARELLGCVVLRGEARGAYVGMLAVRPGLQGLGIGRRLLNQAERRARSEFGAERVRMTVIEQREELIAWYKRRGYLLTECTEPFPYGNSRCGLPKRNDLRFAVLEKALGVEGGA